MNKSRRKILRYLYNANKNKYSRLWPISYIKDNTGITLDVIGRETEYLKQKGYIEKEFLATASISGYSCRITAQGIDEIESNPVLRSFKWIIKELISKI